MYTDQIKFANVSLSHEGGLRSDEETILHVKHPTCFCYSYYVSVLEPNRNALPLDRGWFLCGENGHAAFSICESSSELKTSVVVMISRSVKISTETCL